ncbi:Uncharacterised protein [Bordetella pertussis]|nr:Uncharacterised protein [Bordetella pertussis]
MTVPRKRRMPSSDNCPDDVTLPFRNCSSAAGFSSRMPWA